MIGPIVEETEFDGASMRVSEWYYSGGDLADISLTSYATNQTLEAAAAFNAQTNTWRVFRNEPLLLNSGRPGWVIATKPLDRPDDLMRVSVILVWNGHYHNVRLFGSIYDGTYDYDHLLGIGRTLCAE